MTIANPFRSLRAKIVLLTCGIAIAVSLMVGGLSYLRSADALRQDAVESLAAETRLIALRFQSAYDTLRAETEIVSRTPPIEGLQRSRANGDMDPMDGSTTEQWRNRLATIFRSVMQERPHYTQMRLIGLADSGREVVRVNRAGDGFETVAPEDLQQKSDEPYVRPVLEGRRSFYFSKVTLNREHGVVEDVPLPTIRAVAPVFDAAGDPWGMLVINVDFEAMLQQMFLSARPGKRAFLVNQSGDYAEFDPAEGAARLNYHEWQTTAAPGFITDILNAEQDEAVRDDDTHLTYYVRMQIDKSQTDEFVGAILRLPLSERLAAVQGTQLESLLLTLLLAAISVPLAAYVGHRLTLPLRRMTENIGASGDHAEHLELPVDLRDEIGALARAFQGMISTIAEKNAERDRLIADLERSNAELDQFAYVASHDLKAPLRVIDNASRWLEEDLGAHLDEECRENMGLLRNRVKRMERLLDDLLEYSRIGRKTGEGTDDIVAGDALGADVMSLLAPPGGFTIRFSPKFADIRLPRMPLRHVLLNLVSNAIKHHDRPDGLIEVDIEDEGDFWAITVTDDGPGIEPQFHDRVFKMFQTLKPRDKVEGSGMGLAMVRKHVEFHGGDISLQSDAGQGLALRFTWPKDQARAYA